MNSGVSKDQIYYWAFLFVRHMEISFDIRQKIEHDGKFVTF